MKLIIKQILLVTPLISTPLGLNVFHQSTILE